MLEIWDRLVKSGDIYLDKYSGWYSVSDEAFYDEDEIEDKIGKKISKFPLVHRLSGLKKNLIFLNYLNGLNKLLDHYKTNKDFILPISRKNEVIKFVKKV